MSTEKRHFMENSLLQSHILELDGKLLLPASPYKKLRKRWFKKCLEVFFEDFPSYNTYNYPDVSTGSGTTKLFLIKEKKSLGGRSKQRSPRWEHFLNIRTINAVYYRNTVPETNHHSQSEHLKVSRGAGFCEVMMFLLLERCLLLEFLSIPVIRSPLPPLHVTSCLC